MLALPVNTCLPISGVTPEVTESSSMLGWLLYSTPNNQSSSNECVYNMRSFTLLLQVRECIQISTH